MIIGGWPAMADAPLMRKLAAIFSTDVKGYSRLMQDDEEATVATITAYRELISKLVEEHRGRVVDAPGDNLLAEFASVVNAVRSGLAIQKELNRRNGELPEHRRMEFRIGINLGDVIEEAGRLYGDGVNVAARIEGLADPGGICISESSYHQVKGKLPNEFEYLGKYDVKNIAEPVQVYRVKMEPSQESFWRRSPPRPRQGRQNRVQPTVVAAVLVAIVVLVAWNLSSRKTPGGEEVSPPDEAGLPLPDLPSIAVLPFDNLSGAPEQEYLADGLSENIITALAKIPEMVVIARNSTFTYKGRAVKAQEVSKDLGVRHVLEGSVQTSGDQIRVTAQLIDATTGHHVWAEHYDRRLEDLFAVQDDITLKIAVAMAVQLTEGEQAAVRHRGTNDLQAWGYAVRGYGLVQRYTKEDNAKGQQLLEQAVARDPGYAWAWAWLGWSHWLAARFGFSEDRKASFKESIKIAEKALAVDPAEPDVHALKGAIHLFRKEYDEAIAAGRQAIELGPGNAENHALLGMYMKFAGRYREAIEYTEKAIRLQPHYPKWYLFNVGTPYLWLREPTKAIPYLLEICERQQDIGGPHLMWAEAFVACAYAHSGQEEEARTHVARVLDVAPEASIAYLKDEAQKQGFSSNASDIDYFLEGLHKAGLREESL